MKKVVIFSLLIAVLLCFTACGDKKEPIDLVKESISSRDVSVHVALCNNYFIEMRRTESEKVINVDGKKGETSQSAVLSLIPRNAEMANGEYKVTIKGENSSKDYTLTKSATGTAYTAELVDIDALGALKSVAVDYNNAKEEIDIVDKMSDAISWEKAVEIAYGELKDAVAEDMKEKAFEREVYVKYINNPKQPDSKYYWYVSMLKNNDEYCSALIDPADGAIVNTNLK